MLEKVYDNSSTIHHVPYADDVLRVSVVIVYDGDAQVPFPTLEVQFVRQAIGTFVGWATHLVKVVSDEVFSFPSMHYCFVIIKKLFNCYFH